MYQEGDIVKVRSDLKCSLYQGWGVSPSMQDYCGQSARIVRVGKDSLGFPTFGIDLDDDKFVWTKGMFEDVTNLDKTNSELLHKIESKVHGQHPVKDNPAWTPMFDKEPTQDGGTALLDSTFGMPAMEMLDELIGKYKIDSSGNLEARTDKTHSDTVDALVYGVQVMKRMEDPVNHPSHYTDGSIEVIDFIEDKKMPYHLGNAIKYISRAGKKDSSKTIEDLEKAIWYINRYIELLSK